MSSPLEDRLTTLLGPAIEGLGFELVRIRISGGGKATIQVMAERPDRTMTVTDCARVSREISAVLDVEDPMAGEYTLEVSSPGIDRPLTRLKDFEDFKSLEAKVETRALIDGQKRFRGILAGVEKDRIKLLMEGREIEILFEDIERAKLVMTDKLVRDSLKGDAT